VIPFAWVLTANGAAAGTAKLLNAATPARFRDLRIPVRESPDNA
jgi:hypothetical protein